MSATTSTDVHCTRCGQFVQTSAHTCVTPAASVAEAREPVEECAREIERADVPPNVKAAARLLLEDADFCEPRGEHGRWDEIRLVAQHILGDAP